MSGRTFAFLVDDQEIRLPVTPSRYRWGNAQQLNNVDIDAVGSVALPGRRVAHTDSVECMFPAQRYPFCSPGAVIDPMYYIRLFERIIAEHKVVRYIVEGRVNVSVLVEDITYEERDGTKDVYATIYLAEHIELDAVITETRTTNPDTGNYNRSGDAGDGQTESYTVVSGDTLSAICRRFYGNGSPTYYKALAKYNSIKNPNLIFPGQQLVIPPASQMGVSG